MRWCSEEGRKDAVVSTQRTEYYYKTEDGITTRYTVVYDVLTWPDEKDIDGEPVTAESYCPYSFKEEIISGNDINCDGTFSVADAVMLQKRLHGLGGMNMVNTKLADVCKDGVIDVFDLCRLKTELLKASA